MSDDSEPRSFILFGTDLQRVPCFKRSFTVGISSGIVAGLGHFLFTSKVKRSTDIAVYSFAGTTLCYWIYCRYKWSKERSLTSLMNESVHDVMIGEGAKRKFREA